MMIAGTICEYNPFHNGHKYHLEQIRKDGAECVVVCMSGNFTQRGEPAVYNKYVRTRCALLNGADLVVELPVTFACAGAERFAYGGVFLLDRTGCVDKLYFGSECGNISLIREACEAVTDDRLHSLISEKLRTGVSFAAAREQAAAQICSPQAAAVLREPNDILALEYLKALKKTGSTISPVPVKRYGTVHDSNNFTGNIASASMIRKMIADDDPDFRRFIPDNTVPVIDASPDKPCSGGRMKALEQTILYRLRTMGTDGFAQLPDMSEGLENRLYSSVRKSVSVSQVYENCKCKRYSLARIRRAVMHSFLGFTRDDFLPEPKYIRVLGFSSAGRAALKIMRESAELPVIMRYADILKLDSACRRMYDLESRCDDIYALTCDPPLPCGINCTANTVIV